MEVQIGGRAKPLGVTLECYPERDATKLCQSSRAEGPSGASGYAPIPCGETGGKFWRAVLSRPKLKMCRWRVDDAKWASSMPRCGHERPRFRPPTNSKPDVAFSEFGDFGAEVLRRGGLCVESVLLIWCGPQRSCKIGTTTNNSPF